MIQISTVVHGKVQGVAFRYYTKLQAESLGITGTVTNRSDGTVAIDAIGESNTIDSFVEWLHHGSPASEVKSVIMVEHKLVEKDDCGKFMILR